MTKEFVPYQQALELKELGFDEPCLANYSDDGILQPVMLIEKQNTNNHFASGGYFKEMCTAPLYQQAFRWFREKHDIQGYIYSSTVRGNVEKTKQFTGYIWNINGIDMPFLSTDARDELHDTYEEAELACLIKLIEITKTK
jgi:hypothetical protein